MLFQLYPCRRARKVIQINGYSRSPKNWLWKASLLLRLNIDISDLEVHFKQITEAIPVKA